MSRSAQSEHAIKIVLAGVPGLTAALVRECSITQAGIEIVGECRQPDELPVLTQKYDVDVIVTVLSAAGVPDACQRALFGSRGLPVIAIGNDGRLETYDRVAHREAAMDDLFQEIRRVAAPRADSASR